MTRRPSTRPAPESAGPHSLARIASSRSPKASRPNRFQTPCSPHHRSLGGDLWHRAPLLRFVAPSTHEDGCVHSRTGEPARAAALPAAVFRPRRFYGLDGLLRNPSLFEFPRTTLMGFGSPSRDSRLARTAPFPARSAPLELDVPALPPQSLPFTPDHRSFRGLLLEATVIARIRFPSCKDSSPSWASLGGTSLIRAPRSPKGA